MEDYNERLAELVPDEANMGGNQEVAEVKASMLPVEESPVDVHPSVKPTPVIQESTKISSVVKAENLPEHHNQESPLTPLASPPERCSQTTACSAAAAAAAAHPPEQSAAPKQDVGEDIARVLHQVVSTPKVEYMRFDGDPLKYVSFMHNFETCLEKRQSRQFKTFAALNSALFWQSKGCYRKLCEPTSG